MIDGSFDPARMFRAMENYGHSGALGLRYAAHDGDWAELAMPWRAEMVGDVGQQTMASGAVIALLDMTAGMAVWTTLGHFRPMVTLDLRIDYLRAAHPRADMAGRVECYRVARDVAFVRGVAHDGDADDPVAHMAATFMFIGEPMAARGSDANPVGASSDPQPGRPGAGA